MMEKTVGIKLLFHTYIVFLLSVSVFVFYWQSVPLRIIRDIVPQEVISDLTVNGYPAFKVGQNISIEGEKCNDSNSDVFVMGGYHYKRLDVVTFLDGEDGFTIRSPGCKLNRYTHKMPKEMVPGVWVVEGYDRLVLNGQEQIVPWYSEDFLVIE